VSYAVDVRPEAWESLKLLEVVVQELIIDHLDKLSSLTLAVRLRPLETVERLDFSADGSKYVIDLDVLIDVANQVVVLRELQSRSVRFGPQPPEAS
jgi:hypothetical protein